MTDNEILRNAINQYEGNEGLVTWLQEESRQHRRDVLNTGTSQSAGSLQELTIDGLTKTAKETNISGAANLMTGDGTRAPLESERGETSDNDLVDPRPSENFIAADVPTLSDIARDAAGAVRGGDAEVLVQLMKNAFDSVNGDKTEFVKFGRELASQLRAAGFAVKFEHPDGRLSIHREGSPHAVQFRMTRDSANGKVEVRTMAYDWLTKNDIDKRAEDVIADFRLPGKNDAPKDGAALGADFARAYKENDYSKVHREIAQSVAQAWVTGGMQSVRILEKIINDASGETNGLGPVVIEENGNLQIYNGRSMGDRAIDAAEMTVAQRASEGIVKHPQFGYVRLLHRGPVVPLGITRLLQPGPAVSTK